MAIRARATRLAHRLDNAAPKLSRATCSVQAPSLSLTRPFGKALNPSKCFVSALQASREGLRADSLRTLLSEARQNVAAVKPCHPSPACDESLLVSELPLMSACRMSTFLNSPIVWLLTAGLQWCDTGNVNAEIRVRSIARGISAAIFTIALPSSRATRPAGVLAWAERAAGFFPAGMIQRRSFVSSLPLCFVHPLPHWHLFVLIFTII